MVIVEKHQCKTMQINIKSLYLKCIFNLIIGGFFLENLKFKKLLLFFQADYVQATYLIMFIINYTDYSDKNIIALSYTNCIIGSILFLISLLFGLNKKQLFGNHTSECYSQILH